MAPTNPLALLEEDARLAYLRHAARPFVHGPAGEHLRLWASLYEARACLSEQNPAFASTLLPRGGFIPLPAPGLPLLPTGVRWAVDEDSPGTVRLAVELAGGVSFSVLPPASERFVPPVTELSTRTSTSFSAPLDGLYRVRVLVGAFVIARLYIPVMRVEFRRFRENSRAVAFGFRPVRPRPSGAYLQRLACLIAADAAAQTGQPELYASLMESAGRIEQAPSPVALYPHG